MRARLGFHHHTPEQAAVCLAFHQQATDKVGGDELGGAGEEGLGKGLGERGGYGSGLGEWVEAIGTPFSPSQQHMLYLMTQPFANPCRHDQGHQ